MDAKHLLKTGSAFLLCVVTILGATACEPEPTGPRAWIDSPMEGTIVPAGSPVAVLSHVDAQGGVAEVLLSVNGQVYRRQPPESGVFSKSTLEWFPDKEGDYLLEVTAFSRDGEASTPARVRIRVTGKSTATATSTPLLPTTTRLPLTPTPPTIVITPPTSSATPTRTRTVVIASPTPGVTPPTRTPTTFVPPSPAQVNFRADQTTITRGECTTLRWDVENATGVYLDGGGVPGHSSQQVCPASTTTYRLHVTALAGDVDRTVTITVQQPVSTPTFTPTRTRTPTPTPSDTQGPPAPAVVSPSGTLSCRSNVTLDWNSVSDPSGIKSYEVKLERYTTPGGWQSAGSWTTSATSYNAPVSCSNSYRWQVRAEDNASNEGAWSSMMSFSVSGP